jgi:twitching motility protein PilT
MELNDVLAIAMKGGASDIHLKSGLPAMFRINGTLVPLKDGPRISAEEMSRMALSIMNNFQRERFKQFNELDLAYGVPGLGRFRCQRLPAARHRRDRAARHSLQDPDDPRAHPAAGAEDDRRVRARPRARHRHHRLGQVDDSLAAMIDHINTTRHESHRSRSKTRSSSSSATRSRSSTSARSASTRDALGQALRSALRQDPDVILVGEMRDLRDDRDRAARRRDGPPRASRRCTRSTRPRRSTASSSVFPPHQQKQVRMQLGSGAEGGDLASASCRRADGKGRVAALEIMRTTPRVRELVEDKDRTKEICDAIAEGHITYGMQTFDQALMALLNSGQISYEEALRQASNPSNFALRVQGIQSASDSKWDSFERPGEQRSTAGHERAAAPRTGSAIGKPDDRF